MAFKRNKKGKKNSRNAPKRRPARRSAEPRDERLDDRYDERFDDGYDDRYDDRYDDLYNDRYDERYDDRYDERYDDRYDERYDDNYGEDAYDRRYDEDRRDRRDRRTRPSESYRDDDMLGEFSDDTNSFYTDERRDQELIDERNERARRNNRKGSKGKGKKRKPAKKKKSAKKPKPEKQRKPLSPAQRRAIRIISYVSIIAVVLIVGVILSLTVLFKTQAYEVSGITKYTEEQIIDACGIKKGENIFLAPKRAAENRIKKAFPYVEESTVSFKIPDTIRIAVVEAVEGYLVKVNQTEYLVISTKGRILDRVTDISQYDLPTFIGPTLTSGEIGDYVSYEDDKVVDMIESITQTFADNGYQGITEIDATNMADISFTYENRIKVKLGIPEDLDYKIRTAMIIINDKIDSATTVKTAGVLDVSRCNTTKRSYFDEATPTVNPSEAATEAATTPSADTGGSSGGTADNSGGNYYVPEDDYSYYAYADDGYGGYAADGYYGDYGAYTGEW